MFTCYSLCLLHACPDRQIRVSNDLPRSSNRFRSKQTQNTLYPWCKTFTIICTLNNHRCLWLLTKFVLSFGTSVFIGLPLPWRSSFLACLIRRGWTGTGRWNRAGQIGIHIIRVGAPRRAAARGRRGNRRHTAHRQRPAPPPWKHESRLHNGMDWVINEAVAGRFCTWICGIRRASETGKLKRIGNGIWSWSLKNCCHLHSRFHLTFFWKKIDLLGS